jgi:hypothetical protein
LGSQRRADKDFLIGSELVEPKFYNPLHIIYISEFSKASFKNLSVDEMGHQEKGNQLGGGKRGKWELVLARKRFDF